MNNKFIMDPVILKNKLDYLRKELRNASISYGELAELYELKDYIDPSDVELLEAAGVPEFDTTIEDKDRNHIAEQIQLGENEGDFTGEDGTRIMWSLTIDMKL